MFQLMLFFTQKVNLTNQKKEFLDVYWIWQVVLLYNVTDRKRGDSVVALTFFRR